jgi:dienelactone hydrolase
VNVHWRELRFPVGDGEVAMRLGRPAVPALRPGLLLNLAGDHATQLQTHPYDIPVRAFLAAGHAVASVEMPGHGDRLRPGDPAGIACFAAGAARGEDVLGRFVADLGRAIDGCIAAGLVSPGAVFAAGTSRGGYVALRLAAECSHLAGVAAYAPVTDWRVLSEFAAVSQRPEVAAMALVHWAPRLAGRPIWIGMGNRDTRVGTTQCLGFAAAVAAAERDLGCPSAFCLHVVPEEGHSLAAPWRQRGAEYLLDQAAWSSPAGEGTALAPLPR